jgi:hypothetical protein
MYTELFRPGELPLSLGSERRWHFDDQGIRNVYNSNITVRTGDVIQSTCVMDSSGRTEITVMGRETTDEMCWHGLTSWHKDVDNIKTKCEGYFWSGVLADGESAFGIAERHPYSHAQFVWDGSNLLTGGHLIISDGKRTTGCANAANQQQCKTVSAMSERVPCNGDGPRNAMALCCEAVCLAPEGRCRDEQQCKEKLAWAAGANEQTHLPTLSWDPTYKMQVSSCNSVDNGFMTFEIDAPDVPGSAVADKANEMSHLFVRIVGMLSATAFFFTTW